MSATNVCRKCGAGVGWIKRAGKWMLVSLDGRPHFEGCAPRMIPADFKPPCGKCSTLPWEECACSFAPDIAARINQEADERLRIELELL